ncbi:MAG: hypothetical protein A3F84_22285 [Candidatus Handelsmanbacteria bacterium RIFCSPLOWO2_12_FULL_64_10]|uniref:NRDE family protein n=1 Tax=Handelsmanbacteria sp. (strain RIFCSPLOWO2_12_FULL_64_10) TaxID=1817868 RepID=A0A1F6CC78_HANXR|nr:MAG: hypothetical protein A3F84_22285 [Candidatus Handelsmanbacteria bacterium RIFCSPLOWO2_12_FULL_64_10]
MCFILALFQMRADYPLIVAANREERRDRLSTTPFRWEGKPALWAGKDEVAGGTWFGVNSRGVFAAITNRRGVPADRTLLSRGTLCIDALRAPSTEAALAAMEARLEANPSNAFNFVCADVAGGWTTTWRGRTRDLSPGIHLITSRGEPDDRRLSVTRRAKKLLGGVDLEAPLDDLLAGLGSLCADTGGTDPICRPGNDRGTVSSSLLALGPSGEVAAYLHAEGPPTENAYVRVDLE